MIRFFKRLLCSHQSERKFIRNIYGDEIDATLAKIRENAQRTQTQEGQQHDPL